MKTIKKISLALLLTGASISFTSCESESTVQKQSESFEFKIVTKIYEGSGFYNSNLEGQLSLLLPELPQGSNYKFYTDSIYNFSYKDDVINDNKILIFMEIEGSEDRDLSQDTGVMQPPFAFNLNNITDIPGSTPLDTNEDIMVIIMHDDELDLQDATDNYFGIIRKTPKKAGMSLILKRPI